MPEPSRLTVSKAAHHQLARLQLVFGIRKAHFMLLQKSSLPFPPLLRAAYVAPTRHPSNHRRRQLTSQWGLSRRRHPLHPLSHHQPPHTTHLQPHAALQPTRYHPITPSNPTTHPLPNQPYPTHTHAPAPPPHIAVAPSPSRHGPPSAHWVLTQGLGHVLGAADGEGGPMRGLTEWLAWSWWLWRVC